jgi:Activator of Hsp90 ATPase, N-terminal
MWNPFFTLSLSLSSSLPLSPTHTLPLTLSLSLSLSLSSFFFALSLSLSLSLSFAYQMFESITVKEVTCEGDAQVVGMRGKIKHICDITATVDWIIRIPKNTPTTTDQTKMETSVPTTATEEIKDEKEGEEIILKMTVADITSDGEFEFEISYPKISVYFTSVQKSFLSSNIKVLENAVKESLKDFLESFKQK